MNKKVFLAERPIIEAKNNGRLDNKADFLLVLKQIQTEIRGISDSLKSSQSSAPSGDDETNIIVKNAKLELEKTSLEAEKYRNETNNLKRELTDLSAAIQQTKNEIASLSPTIKSSDNINAVSDELDEIVKATEGATQSILDKAEKIDNIAANIIAASGGNQHLVNYAHELSENVIGIYESCNFQDLTGQRINKAVKALKYIDERISNMIMIWGEEAIAELAEKVEKSKAKTGDESLLNGPALSRDAIGQDDIDKFFS